MNFGKVFKAERERLSLSQREMAKQLKLTASALWKIEAGRTQPKQDTIKKLCEVACIAIAYFYIRSMEPNDFQIHVGCIATNDSTAC